jgi:non-specific serine/threonine protein kinase
VAPEFPGGADGDAEVAALCERLEGIPLAIELAAARAAVLTLGQMHARLSERFALLAAPNEEGPERHRSLHAALAWSYRLLSPELQPFFARLSVFRGGWTEEATAAVCDEPAAINSLEQLREGSMIESDVAGGEVRFRMLETLREFAAEQLTPGAVRQPRSAAGATMPNSWSGPRRSCPSRRMRSRGLRAWTGRWQICGPHATDA